MFNFVYVTLFFFLKKNKQKKEKNRKKEFLKLYKLQGSQNQDSPLFARWEDV